MMGVPCSAKGYKWSTVSRAALRAGMLQELMFSMDFPIASPESKLTAKVIGWSSNPEVDIALLEINEELPENVQRILLHVPSRDIAGHSFEVCGFPDGIDYGIWSFGQILRTNAKGYIQIESNTAYHVQRGFSGSLVWDSTENSVVGMIIAADIAAAETKTAYFIPSQTIAETYPHLIPAPPTKPFKYSCFISYPVEEGVQGQKVREVAEAIHEALSEEIGSMISKPIYGPEFRDRIRSEKELT